jgi:hypothetical protein
MFQILWKKNQFYYSCIIMTDLDLFIDTHSNTTLVLFMLDISIVIFILYYLFQLRFCSCFNENNIETSNEINIVFIIELVLLGVYICNFIQLRNLFMRKTITENPIKTLVSMFGVMTVIYILLFYYFETLKTKVNLNCPCFHSTLTYLMYFQMIFFSISYIYLFHKLFFRRNNTIK